MNRGVQTLGSIRGRSHASAVYLRRTIEDVDARIYDWLCQAASFPPALFLALLEGQEQLAGPGCGDLVIWDGRDTDACAPQPEMRKDALTAFPTLWDAFH